MKNFMYLSVGLSAIVIAICGIIATYRLCNPVLVDKVNMRITGTQSGVSYEIERELLPDEIVPFLNEVTEEMYKDGRKSGPAKIRLGV